MQHIITINAAVLILMYAAGCSTTPSEPAAQKPRSDPVAALPAGMSSSSNVERQKALAIITQLGGNYEEDASLLGKPITKVNLAGTKTSNIELLKLKCLTSLTSLNLNSCDAVGDVGLAAVENMKDLDSLDLGHCFKMTDQGLEHLAGLTKLTSLKLQESGSYTYTGAGLVHLKGLTRLRVLHLTYSLKLEDRHLVNLTSLIKLQDLDLKRCEKLTDAALEHLGQLSSLEKLNLAGTQVTDAGVHYLKGLKQLKELTLGEDAPMCQTKVTDAGVAELQAAIPGLNIKR